MKKLNFRSFILISGVVLLAMVFGLWSWNTLAELFGGPHAQFKHVLAVTTLVLVSKWIIAGHPKHRCHGDDDQCLVKN